MQKEAKEGAAAPGLNGRKSSVSHGAGNAGSGQPSRPGTRRRDTTESIFLNPLSPAFNRSGKDDGPGVSTPPASLTRRKTDFKDNVPASAFGERPKLDTGIDAGSLFGSLKRTTTNPASAGVNGPSSPWTAGPAPSGFGAFGNFSLDWAGANPLTPGDKKSGFGSMRSESRFKGLMSKDSSEDMSLRPKEKGSALLERLHEADAVPSWGQDRSVRPMSEDSNLWGDPERVESAAPGRTDLHHRGGDVPKAQSSTPFAGFSAPSEQSSFAELMNRRENRLQDTSQSHDQLSGNSQEPMSPTDTNPYQSPESDRRPAEHEGGDDPQADFYAGGYSGRPGHPPFEEGDRSQNSSAGATRGFPALGGLGGLGAIGNPSPWSAAPGPIGTPNRATAGFASIGDPQLNPVGDVQPSSAGGFAAMGSAGFGAFGRSKMGSLFPPQMQEQMRSSETGRGDQSMDEGLSNRNISSTFRAPVRDTESPATQSRSVLDDLFSSGDRNRGAVSSPFGPAEGVHASMAVGQVPASAALNFTSAATLAQTPAATAASNSESFSGRTPDPESSGSSQLPAAQQRQMVMPDRMRWIYRDPQGNTQGPWSGLEMHDWYKAGFFSPELLVKKVEDNDYEPLAQLIRRIGNSREPFLVPQIGIPHGATGQPSQSTIGITKPGPPSGTVQPPFASSFPSFGTTLTADQQNALERRKQEEQYLMARQKEHLMQQQVFLKQMHVSGLPHGMSPQQLHHHSSAHSLQSQPSYGSITSPIGYQPSPGQMPMQPPGPMSGVFDLQMRPGTGGPGHPSDAMPPSREMDLNVAAERMDLGPPGRDQFSMVGHGPPDSQLHQQQVASAMHDRARLQKEQQQADALQQDGHADGLEAMERFEQFRQLRTQESDPSFGTIGGLRDVPEASGDVHGPAHTMSGAHEFDQARMLQGHKTEQDLAAKPTTIPAPSISPLPAPSAQRHRGHVPDNLNAGTRSRSETPQQDTPATALAPWAKENADQSSKGPSLKEIQEAEARKAARQEEVLAAARRAQAEQERVLAAQAPAPAPAPGLPSSANWAAAGSSPLSTAPNGPSAWTKPLAGKIATPAGPNKKTLAQIQKEEEARKNRAVAASAENHSKTAVPSATGAGGKRYADLAGKVPASTPTATGGNAWMTVGAGGKAKTPAGAAPAPGGNRTTSGGATAASITQPPKSRPTAPARAATGGVATSNAHDEFVKWIKGALGKGLTSTQLSGMHI